jgi:hypothetical protein
MIQVGFGRGRCVVVVAHAVALAIRGGALAAIQNMLNNISAANAGSNLQELVLPMLQLSPDESSVVVERANRLAG